MQYQDFNIVLAIPQRRAQDVDRAAMIDRQAKVGAALVFGVAVGLIAGFLGLRTTGGAAGVGKAANDTVTLTVVLILVADYFISMALLSWGL